MKNHTKHKTKLLRVLAAVSAGGFLLAQQAVLFSANVFAEPIETPVYSAKTLADIDTMQEMTQGVCERTPDYVDTSNYVSKQLTDTRDGKSYWVAKLKDGNCWMTQNLDLDLDGVTLKTTDSDVTSDWTSTTGPSTMIGYNNTDYHKAQYYDAGEYVYTDPTTSKNCNAGADGLAGGTCAADGWVNVSGMAASSDPNFGTSVTNNVYNAHYLAGNRYSWAAATAGQGATITSTETTDYPAETTQSICPKGWTLPKSGRDSEGVPFNTNTTFAKLFESYSWQWNAYNESSKYYYSDSLNGGTSYDLRIAPFYFLYGGYVNNGSLGGAGSQGWYWSSTAYNASAAYLLNFNSGGVNPSYSSYRYFGFSVRCVNNPNTPDTKIPEIDNPNVTVTVPPVLTMTLTESVDINVKSNAISTGNFVAKVTSNAPYTISLSATQNGHTDLRSTENGSIPASDDIKAGESGWGIKCIGSNCVNDSGTGILNTRYNALTEYGTPKIYFDSPSVAADQETSFEVGIGVDPSLASGTYATDVLVTAAQK